MSFREILRTVISHIDFRHIFSIVCIRKAACKTLFTFRQRIDKIVTRYIIHEFILIIKQHGIYIMSSERAVIIYHCFQINPAISCRLVSTIQVSRHFITDSVCSIAI